MNITDRAQRIRGRDPRALARAATAIENGTSGGKELLEELPAGSGTVVGITGPPGAGKSSLVNALVAEIRKRGKTAGILAVDPTSRKTTGAILGDRIRMLQHHNDPGVYIRSTATRGAGGGLARTTADLARLLRGAGFDYVLVETVGAGQNEIEVAKLAGVTILVLVPGMGDDVQAIKAGIMEIAGIYVINKSDHPGAGRTEHEIRSEIGDVPILRTVATEGKGVAELLDAIDSCPKTVQPACGDAEAAIQSINEALRSLEAALGMQPGSLMIDYRAVRIPEAEAALSKLREARSRLSQS